MKRDSRFTPDDAAPAHRARREVTHEFRGGLPERIAQRLREDFRLAMVSLFALIAVALISPFAVFRLVNGDWKIALLDAGIVVAIMFAAVHAWCVSRSETAGKMVAVIVTASALAAIVGFDLSPMWVLSVMVANFLLATSWLAAVLSALLIGLVLGHDPAFSTVVERWTFLAVSAQVALYSFIFAWRSSSRSRSLEFLAETDPLTRLGNRRALRHDLARLVGMPQRTPGGLAVAMLDLDHFKKINDAQGHDVGDRVLEDLAAIIAQSIRGSDRGYRFGGEEFVLILQGVGASGLASAMKKLQRRVRESLASPAGPVTVSIGATLVEPDEGVDACLRRADQAMYLAKKKGRDRTEIV